MTPEQIKLVQESFKKIEPIAMKAADLFYNRLFEIAPEVRPLFPVDLSDQKGKLMSMLTTAVRNLDKLENIIPAVQELGKRHMEYNVKSEHYEAVGTALIWTLEQGLGEGFTPDVRDAWLETYGTLAGVMTQAAEKAA